MKLQPQRVSPQSQRAFTLVEMIGVLAIIAILASLLIPRVFQAIGDSKISAAASSCNSIKAAVNEYYGKYGLLAGPQGAPLPAAEWTGNIFPDWDLKSLVAEGVAEKPFSVRIGNGKIGSADSGSHLRLIQISANDKDTDPSADIDSGAYNLDGSSTNLNDVTGTLIVEAVIEEVDAQDAKALNDRIDGPNLGATIVMTNDWAGRVKYDVPDANLKTSVRVYMAHR